MVSSVTVLVDGRRALSGSGDQTLRLWDLEIGAELRRFEGHEGEVSSVAVLADGRRALSGSYDKTLRLWDLETGAELACLTFDAALSDLAWSEQMAAAVVGDGRGLLHVIELLEWPTGRARIEQPLAPKARR